jgi:hypothetical protein
MHVGYCLLNSMQPHLQHMCTYAPAFTVASEHHHFRVDVQSNDCAVGAAPPGSASSIEPAPAPLSGAHSVLVSAPWLPAGGTITNPFEFTRIACSMLAAPQLRNLSICIVVFGTA